MCASSPLAKRRCAVGDVPLHVAEEAGHVGGAHAADDPGAAGPERAHAGEVREALDGATADQPVDEVGGGVVREGDHARERRAHGGADRAVPPQVDDEHHRLDDARRDERLRSVVAVQRARGCRPRRRRRARRAGPPRRRRRAGRGRSARAAAAARARAARRSSRSTPRVRSRRRRARPGGSRRAASCRRPRHVSSTPTAVTRPVTRRLTTSPACVVTSRSMVDRAAGGVVRPVADARGRAAVHGHRAQDGGGEGVAHGRRG